MEQNNLTRIVFACYHVCPYSTATRVAQVCMSCRATDLFNVLSMQHAVLMCQRMWAQQQPTGLSSHLCQPVVHDKGSLLQVSSCSLHLHMVSFRGHVGSI